MSAASVAVELVHSLAWPSVVLIGLGLTRREVRGLLRERLIRVEGLGFSAEFERTSVEIEAATAREGKPDMEPPPGFAGIPPELMQRINTDPTGAILRAYELLTDDLRARLEKAGTTLGRTEIWNANRLAAIAEGTGLISPQSAESVQGLTVMRNLVAHGRGGEVTAVQAADFIELTAGVLYTFRLPPRATPPS